MDVGIHPSGKRQSAIPLCLPRNYRWDSQTGKCIETGDHHSELYVIEEALDQLRKIKGPVCVVSICGPYRKGKSYVLSEAFDQPDVFPLGHEFFPETRGIWLWIIPEKYKDASGQEFTVLLLDTEGSDQVFTEDSYCGRVFTLTVLLSSVLIYNSQGVPGRSDLAGMDFILSQRIQHKSTTEAYSLIDGTKLFYKTFPRFIWLLRDVTLSIPSDCRDVKDFFLQKVFKKQSSGSGDRSNRVAEAILGFFPHFDAFALPPPAVDAELMRNLNENGHKLNPLFLSRLQQLKILLRQNLEAKRSVIEGESLTGEGLAATVQIHVKTLNNPGLIADLQLAWMKVQLENIKTWQSSEPQRGIKDLELEQRNAELEQKNVELQKEIEDQASKLSNSADNLKGKIAVKAVNSVNYTSRLECWSHQKIRELEQIIHEQNRGNQQRIKALEQRNKDLEQKNADQVKELSSSTKNLKAFQQKTQELQQKVQEQRNNHKGFQRKLKELEQRNTKLEEKLQEQDNKLEHTMELDRYEIGEGPRGICLVINNVDFRGEDERHGGEVDEKKIAILFSEELHFIVVIKRNLSGVDILKSAQEIAAKDHSKYAAFVFIIMSHGDKKDAIHGVDGRKARVEDLMSEFTATNCPTLENKPKLFFIQACRGQSSDRRMSRLAPADNIEGDSFALTLSADSNLPNGVAPREADFLLAFATVPGYIACRSKKVGSWFIQVLVDVILKYHHHHHLQDMLTEVNKKVADIANDYPDVDLSFQVPAPTHTLRAQVYL